MLKGSAGREAFAGKVAFITGGGSGIGKALAEEIASRVGKVILADLNAASARAAAEAIRARGGEAESCELDVADADAVEERVLAAFRKHGRLDYMFNNAGIALNGRYEDFQLSHWRKTVDINLMGVVHGAMSAHRVMTQQGHGHIVNTASFAGLFPWPTTIAYTATKYAVVGLSTALRAELGGTGIRVSVLCPGPILTPMIVQGSSPQRWVGSYDKEKLDKFFRGARGMAPDVFAKKALDQVARNKGVIVLPPMYHLLWWINRASPAAANRVGTTIFRAIMERIS